jgi:hypothetical protein
VATFPEPYSPKVCRQPLADDNEIGLKTAIEETFDLLVIRSLLLDELDHISHGCNVGYSRAGQTTEYLTRSQAGILSLWK